MAKLICDTREHNNLYILQDFDALGVQYEVKKLDEGDYESTANPNVVIDLKGGILEVQSNIAGKNENRARFINECLRCVTKQKTLIVLIREPKIFNINGVQYWKSPRGRNGKPFTKVSGKYIMEVMKSYTENYGVVWEFCKPEAAAFAILRILNKNGGKIYYDYEYADKLLGAKTARVQNTYWNHAGRTR